MEIVSKHLKGMLHKRLLRYILLYSIMIISLVTHLQQLINEGYTQGDFFLKGSLSLWQTDLSEEKFWKKYIYELTHVMIGEPLSFITGAMPYLETCKEFAPLFGEAAWGFTLEDNEKEVVGHQSYSPELPKEQLNIDLEKFKDYYYVLKNFMTGDKNLALDIDILKQWNFYELMNRKLELNEVSEGEPQILIFHTHAREAYIGGQTVVDFGEELKKELETKYGIKVLHVTDEFYNDSNKSVYPDGTEYENIEDPIRKILEENPSISMCMDIHRDGLENVHLVTDIDGKPTAKIMLVNGLSMHRGTEGDIVHKKGLLNPYLEDNIALSMQLEAVGYEYYPGLMRKIYCKPYRYSTHMKPLSLLVELGADTNTWEEARNAATPLANIIAKVLQKD